MNQLEKDVLALAGPLVLQLWNDSILPKLQALSVNVSQPELAVLSQDGVAAVNKLVVDELAALQAQVAAS
jgi:hypothetical protein